MDTFDSALDKTKQQEGLEISLGLAKKSQSNDLEEYKRGLEKNREERMLGNLKMQKQVTQGLIDEMKRSPEFYFNFGFTYDDFKAYLMKTMYCRAVRTFIEKKRLEKIDEYNEKNRGMYDLQDYTG